MLFIRMGCTLWEWDVLHGNFPVWSTLLCLVVLFSCRKEQANLCHLEILFAFFPPDGNSLVSAIAKHTTKSRYDLLTYSK